MPNPSREARALITALFLVAGYAVISPFLYEAQRLLPPQLGSPDWRLGAGGFLLEALTTPTLGLAAALALAWYDERWGLMRLVAWTAILGSVATVVVWALFLREFLAMRPGVPEVGRGVYDAASMRSLVIGGLSAPILLLLGVSGRRLASIRSAEDRARERGIVVPSGSA